MKRCDWKMYLEPAMIKATDPNAKVSFLCPQCQDQVVQAQQELLSLLALPSIPAR